MNYVYEVISCKNASPTTAVYTLHNTDPDRPLPYQPGQYATMSFMRNGRPTPARCFSIASSPTEQHVLQFAMRIKGRYTQAVTKHVQPGDKLTIGGPFGSFIFNAERDRAAVFMAGGIGIAPFMSMIRYATRLGLDNEIVLLYGSRSQADAPFAEELMYHQQKNPHFKVVYVMGEGELSRFDGHQAINGRVTPELLDQVIGGNYGAYSFFMCGPPPFMAPLEAALLERGVPQNRILAEAFNQTKRTSEKGLSLPAKIYSLAAASLMLTPAIVIAADIQSPIRKVSFKTVDEKVADVESSEVTDESVRQTEIDAALDESHDEHSDHEMTKDEATSSSSAKTETPKTGSSSATTPAAPGVKAAPTLTFGANATAVTVGGSVTLSWSAGGTSPTCTAEGGWSGGKASSGNQVVSPTATTTYKLTCANSAGTVTKSVTVTVSAAPVAPTANLSVSSSSIVSGQSTTLSWNTGGSGPITCNATGGWSGSKGASGSLVVSPTSTTTYILTCSNSVGTSTKSVTVTVNYAPTASLSANATTITEGDSVQLSWNTTGTGPITCNATGGWSGSKAASGSQMVSPASTKTYTLTCSSPYGSQTRSITITVEPHSHGS
ncbi:MAG TPA: FAD-binding oxidoreductase [Candidatus Saccharimonadales bacterium]